MLQAFPGENPLATALKLLNHEAMQLVVREDAPRLGEGDARVGSCGGPSKKRAAAQSASESCAWSVSTNRTKRRPPATD